MCFRATYELQILHKGRGFRMKDIITAADIVKRFVDSYGLLIHVFGTSSITS